MAFSEGIQTEAPVYPGASGVSGAYHDRMSIRMILKAFAPAVVVPFRLAVLLALLAAGMTLMTLATGLVLSHPFLAAVAAGLCIWLSIRGLPSRRRATDPPEN